MVGIFNQSSSSPTDERLEVDGNESTASILSALGMFLADNIQQAHTMSYWVIESLQETVSEINKEQRVLYSIPSVP